MRIIDPPSGWKYGFPKPIPDEVKDIKKWLVENGYPQEEIVGRNCRFLQGTDRNQPELDKLRAAIKKGEPIEITLRNYKKNGELFYNRLNVKPLTDDKGRVVYFLGVQYDITDQVNFKNEIDELTSKLIANLSNLVSIILVFGELSFLLSR